MTTIREFLFVKVKKPALSTKPLYTVSLMMFFMALFNGIVSYTTPLIVSEAGYSQSTMGLIVSTSSVFGALFDFLLSKYMRNMHFRRIYLLMIAACFFYPILILNATGLSMFIAAMALWGFFYDLIIFGNFDFVGRVVEKTDHAGGFGIISAFKGTGYLLAPIVSGILISGAVGWKPYILAWIFLLIAIFFYLALVILTASGKYEKIKHENHRRRNLFQEFSLWRKIGRKILPILVFTVLLNMIDSFFWVVGPLISESLSTIYPFGGFLLTAYSLPSLLVGFFVGPIAARFGKKRTAFVSILAGSLILVSFARLTDPILLIAGTFVFSLFTSMAWPAAEGIYADFISEAPNIEGEIEGVGDFSNNVGYIIGPATAGLAAQIFGNLGSFSVLGIIAMITVLILIKITPKHVKVV